MADVDILLVEDNGGDIHLAEHTFEDRELSGTLHTVTTGEAALDWLYQRDGFEDSVRPDLVLLDLNLPATSGQEVLERIKTDSELKRIPVIVLTGSNSEDDLVGAYKRHANACLVKPVDPKDYGDLLQSFVEFWASTVMLPPVSEPDEQMH
jgi:CheY-like chemotaxis protein